MFVRRAEAFFFDLALHAEMDIGVARTNGIHHFQPCRKLCRPGIQCLAEQDVFYIAITVQKHDSRRFTRGEQETVKRLNHWRDASPHLRHRQENLASHNVWQSAATLCTKGRTLTHSNHVDRIDTSKRIERLHVVWDMFEAHRGWPLVYEIADGARWTIACSESLSSELSLGLISLRGCSHNVNSTDQGASAKAGTHPFAVTLDEQGEFAWTLCARKPNPFEARSFGNRSVGPNGISAAVLTVFSLEENAAAYRQIQGLARCGAKDKDPVSSSHQHELQLSSSSGSRLEAQSIYARCVVIIVHNA